MEMLMEMNGEATSMLSQPVQEQPSVGPGGLVNVSSMSREIARRKERRKDAAAVQEEAKGAREALQEAKALPSVEELALAAAQSRRSAALSSSSSRASSPPRETRRVL